MAFKGTLDTLGIVDVLQVVAMTGKTGCLQVEEPRGETKRLYFKDGAVITAMSNAPADRLGELLVKLGWLNREELEAAREAERATGTKQGMMLVDRGLVTSEQLQGALTRQIAQICSSIMIWRHGTFEFFEGVGPGLDVFCARESVMNLIMEGTRQLDEWGLIEKVFASLDVVVAMAAPKDGMHDIRLQPDEWQVLTLVDGQRSIREICALASSTSFEVCKKLLDLHRAGLVKTTHVKTNGTRRKPRSELVFTQAFCEALGTEFTRYVGPMAAILLDEVADSFGCALIELPRSRLPEVLDRLCAEIDAPAKQAAFRDHVLHAAPD